MFEHVDAFAGDPILAVNEAFQRDARPDKVNLSIGVYFGEDGHVPVLDCVREAERRLAARGAPKPYLPIEGAADFRGAVQDLLFGAGHEAIASRRIATIQTVGSSGGIKMGAEFLRHWLPSPGVWVSDPTWENHRALFESTGFAVHPYPYYHASGGVRFAGMMEALDELSPASIVVLHACCHNPAGADLTADQWGALIPLLRDRELFPFLDLAYQGFAEGPDADAFPLRALAEAGVSFAAVNSFSKSMSLYGERCGALNIVCPDAAQAALVLGQLQFVVRRNYSSPPAHGSAIATRVLTDPALRASWVRDLESMRQRILGMRAQLHAALAARMPWYESGYLLTQRGMFSYTGLSALQADRLRDEHAIYLLRSGRMCVAGLNGRNIDLVADAMARVLKDSNHKSS